MVYKTLYFGRSVQEIALQSQIFDTTKWYTKLCILVENLTFQIFDIFLKKDQKALTLKGLKLLLLRLNIQSLHDERTIFFSMALKELITIEKSLFFLLYLLRSLTN